MVEAARRFRAAIERDGTAAPAHLRLGDVQRDKGDLDGAIAAWEALVEVAPDRAYLAFDRLQGAYTALGAPQRFPDLCRTLIAASPQDWRARLALARHRAAEGDAAGALELLFDALTHNPHGLMIHQEIWATLSALGRNQQLIDRYLALTRDAVFYLDPHVCVRCRYRSTELLWQCPQCHEWNTFIEERIAPAKDDEQLSA
jgi:lipopolysaccharide biosynthesis regulator YciM